MASAQSPSQIRDRFRRLVNASRPPVVNVGRRIRSKLNDALPAGRLSELERQPGKRCVNAWKDGEIVVFDVGDGIYCRNQDGERRARHYAGADRGWIDVKGPTTADTIERYGRTHDWETVILENSEFQD